MRTVDAPAAAAFLFEEAEALDIQELMRGHRIAAPAVFVYELANICQTKSRRQPAPREALMASYELLHRLQIKEYPVEQAEVLALAEATRLTHHDASYLWLSRRLNAPLITLDRALIAAIKPPPAAP